MQSPSLYHSSIWLFNTSEHETELTRTRKPHERLRSTRALPYIQGATSDCRKLRCRSDISGRIECPGLSLRRGSSPLSPHHARRIMVALEYAVAIAGWRTRCRNVECAAGNPQKDNPNSGFRWFWDNYSQEYGASFQNILQDRRLSHGEAIYK